MKKGKRVKPIIIDEIDSEKFDVQKFFEKKVFKRGVPVPEGYIRVIVMKDCEGMTGHYYEGDIIDLPERRFKSMRLRGLVDEYKGESGTTRER